jgi:uncharacterized membrane protein
MGDKKLSEEVSDGEVGPEEDLIEEVDSFLPKEAEGISKNESEALNEKRLKKKKVALKGEIIKGSFFTGPLPPPEIFEKYEDVCPGAADRIICMAEKQMSHRHVLEKEFLKSQSRNSIVGIIAAFVIALSIIIVGGVCILKGHSVAGTMLGGLGIGALVATFLKNTRLVEEKYEKDTEDEK